MAIVDIFHSQLQQVHNSSYSPNEGGFVLANSKMHEPNPFFFDSSWQFRSTLSGSQPRVGYACIFYGILVFSRVHT